MGTSVAMWPITLLRGPNGLTQQVKVIDHILQL